jgi:WD40 repeat protein
MNTFFGHSAPISQACFSPDGRFAVSISEDFTLKKWSILKNSCLGTLSDYKFHSKAVHCLDFQPSKDLVITGGDDGVICISGLTSLETYFKSKEFGSPVQTLAVNDKSGVVLVGCISGKLELFSLTNRCKIKEFESQGPVTTCKFLPQFPAFMWLDADGNFGRLGFGDKEGFAYWETGVQGEAHAFVVADNKNVLLALEAGMVFSFNLPAAVEKLLVNPDTNET